MKHILAAAQNRILEQLSWSDVLLGFDFDGTLAPSVSDPDRAAPRARTLRKLGELARLYPCVVISGRSVPDREPRLGGVALRGVIGNPGIEPWRGSDELRRTVARWRTELERALAPAEGVVVEDKRLSLAIHYRRSRSKKAARGAIVSALGELDGARIIGGKQVVNVLPLGAPHKGMALERERDRLGCDTALFVGDDDTDEDVFALDRPGRLLGIRVGRTPASQAPYCLRDQREIDDLLDRLIALRRDAPARPRPPQTGAK
jgi:trehalose 6-phosphate phosphatase